MDNSGYFLLHRKIRNHWIWEDPKKFQWWIDIILLTNHTDKKMMFNGKVKTIKRGTFHTSEIKLSERWKTSRGSVRRFLKLLQDDEMISVFSTKDGTTIEVHNYNVYHDFSLNKKQPIEQPTIQQADNQQDNGRYTTKELKELENIKTIVEYLNSVSNKSFKHTTKKTQSLINARFKEGFTVDDFKRVIDNKCSEWLTNVEMNQYLRPETLFDTKFESYLNSNTLTKNNSSESIDYNDLLEGE